MGNASNKPVIFLAFANDRDDTIGYLRNLPDEARRLGKVLQPAERAGLCEVVSRSNCTACDIFEVFQDPRFRNRIAIFHYGGHANGYQLLLESAEGQSAAADAGGLAAFFAQQRGLQLVFLNGCSTQPQTQELLDANISMVISTSQAIDDKVATDFAFQFYQGLAGNAPIRAAYKEAAAAVRMAKGGDPRGLYFGGDGDRWPWNLYVRDGAESADGWNLPDAANNPLAGLPPLPPLDLPEEPFKHLNYFTRGDAEVFFGRGHQIRELYNRLTGPRSDPIVLFYGQSGVGKSSLLAAGLLPRLERDYEVRYVRRGARGLLETLRSELLPEADDMPIETAWLAREERTGKPLTVFLDQVEEFYTRPIGDMPDELEQLLRVVKATFGDINRRPKGKLVLGFREEWLAKLETRVKEYQLPRSAVHLEPLDRRGIIEAVLGPARSERLHERYALTVEDGLAEMIADDMLADRGSAISTTLQILLSKMWAEAKQAKQPNFSRDLYLDLKDKGILLGDFLDQQLKEFHSRLPVPADSGLLLDVLALHTTDLGSANECSPERLLEEYAHVGDELPGLLNECKNLYLLTELTSDRKARTQTTRLAHDTLAPLVRDKFDKSDKPGQRARRILDSRSVDWENGSTGTTLDEADLKEVEIGRNGTRDFHASELGLVQASKDKRDKSKRLRQSLRTGVVLATITIVVLAVVGWCNYRVAEKAKRDLVNTNKDLETKQKEADKEAWKAKHNLAVNDLSNAAFAMRDHRVADALHWYHCAYRNAPNNDWPSRSALGLLGTWSRLLHSTLKHDSIVLGVAFSPDGQTVLTESWDKTARLWDVHTGLPRGEPLNHDDDVRAMAFSPDGQTVLTGSEDKTARLWDVQTGQPRGEPLRLAGTVRAVAFSPEGQTALTAYDNTARLWDARTGQPRGESMEHDGAVYVVAFSFDGQMLLTGSHDKTARLWDAHTGQPRGDPLKHDGAVVAVAFSPDGNSVLTGSRDNKARLWDAHTGQPRGEPLKHDGAVVAVAFSPVSQMVLTGSFDNTAQLWDVRTGESLGEPLKHDDWVHAVAFSPDGQTVLTGSRDGTARLWDAHTRQPRGEQLKHDGAVYAVAFSPDGRMALTGSGDNSARLWNVRSGEARGEPLKHDEPVYPAAFSPQGKTALTVGDSNSARLWDVRSGEARGEPLKHDGEVFAVAFSPNGQTVLTGSGDNTARLWDTRTGQPRGAPLNHGDNVIAVAFSPDGRTALTGSEGGTARLWDARTGQPRGDPMKHDGVYAVAFSPDRHLVITGSHDTVRLWDANTGQPRGELLKHDDTISDTKLSPDGQTVLTVSIDGTVQLWDAHTRQMQGEALSHDGKFSTVAFSSDGQTVLIWKGDTVRLWDARTGKLRGPPIKHVGDVEVAAISPDGLTVLTGSYDRAAPESHEYTARLWDTGTGQARGVPLKHNSSIYAVAYSPDGQTVLTGSEDGTARLWDVPPLSANEPQRLRLSVEVRTGSEFDENSGMIKPLTQAEWLERQSRLWKEFGGPCDVRTWDQVSDAERKQLRHATK